MDDSKLSEIFAMSNKADFDEWLTDDEEIEGRCGGRSYVDEVAAGVASRVDVPSLRSGADPAMFGSYEFVVGDGLTGDCDGDDPDEGRVIPGLAKFMDRTPAWERKPVGKVAKMMERGNG